MDLQGMQSMALTLGNGHIWLGTPSIHTIYFCILPSGGLQFSLREKHSFSF